MVVVDTVYLLTLLPFSDQYKLYWAQDIQTQEKQVSFSNVYFQ